MKNLLILLFIIFPFLSCVSSDIAVDLKQAALIKSVAVLPFSAKAGIPSEVLREAEASMKSAVIAAGFRLVERENLETLLKEKELGMTGITGENAASLGTLIGADALLAGIIEADEELVRPVHDPKTGTAVEKKFFRFQMVVRLISVKNGAVVLSMQNLSPEVEYNPEFLGYGSLPAYRSLRIRGMRDDFVKSIKEKK